MHVRQRLEMLIDRQYRQPAGIIGRFIGQRMAQQHQPENIWTVTLLAIEPMDQVLEVGFGPGVAIELAASQASQGLVAGVDFSRAMVALAQRRNADAIKAGRVQLSYGEATALPFANASFNKVFSIHTLYFWPEPLRTLVELRRVLKPEGTLVLTFLARDRWPGGEQAATIAGIYSGQEAVQLMRQAGFDEAHIEEGPEQKPFREIAVVASR